MSVTTARPRVHDFARGLVVLVGAAGLVAGCDARSDEGKQAAEREPATAQADDTGYAEVNGARIYYQAHGDLDSGETPLLILHGSFMSADSMAPLTSRFAAARPVIVIDQRGHGRTGDTEGGLTYNVMADDAAGVLAALGVETADVLGYSMGGSVALAMAVRHPERVGRQIILSGAYRQDGWYPEVLQAMEQITPEAFAGTPLKTEYERLSPTPEAFPTLVEEISAMVAQYGWPEEAIRAIEGRTMVIVGDADGVELEHAVELFKLRGGGDRQAAVTGSITGTPRARFAILPATSHIGIMARDELIAEMATAFLEDEAPPMPKDFI